MVLSKRAIHKPYRAEAWLDDSEKSYAPPGPVDASIAVNEILKLEAETIFRAGLEAVDPRLLITSILEREGDQLTVQGKRYQLNSNLKVVAFGKAVLGMIRATEDILGDHIVSGFANIPVGGQAALREVKPDLLPEPDSKVVINEGAANNLPDRSAMRGAQIILDTATQATADDILLVLISGGGSALLPYPAEDITLGEKLFTTSVLAENEATINELNTVRKHLSAIKGGHLAKAAGKAKVLTLILSDVIGDHLDTIASGPTVPDHSTFQDCWDIIQYRGVSKHLPPPVLERIDLGRKGKLPETPKPKASFFSNTQNVIVGNNKMAVQAAARKARNLGYNPLVLSTYIQGVGREVGRVYSAIALEVLQTGHPVPSPACIIGAGETTVRVKGTGTGGRNQEIALNAAIDLDGIQDVLLLCGGTDGQDGPTDAAGAFADGNTFARAKALGIDARRHLQENDSYTFFSKMNNLFITQLTGTNVMDLQVLLVNPEQK